MKLGQRVHCILYGGKDGVIAGIHGALDPDSCAALGAIGVTGGNATIDVIWDDGTTSHVPEALIRRSVQWQLYDEVWSASQIEESRQRMLAEGARKEREAAEKALAMQQAKDDLVKRYPMLLTPEAEPLDGKRAVANVRRLLKLSWPKTKFSVRQSHGSVRIEWRDGPTADQVSAVSRQFEAGRFDGMSDSFEYHTTAWNSLFGSLQYVNQARVHSDITLRRAVDALWANLPNLRDIPKPTQVDEQFCWSAQSPVPGLAGTTVEELVQCLASHYDATTDTYLEPSSKYGRMTFIVSTVREAELALAA